MTGLIELLEAGLNHYCYELTRHSNGEIEVVLFDDTEDQYTTIVHPSAEAAIDDIRVYFEERNII